jgi:3-methyladenine DNA glycosylase AlkC
MFVVVQKLRAPSFERLLLEGWETTKPVTELRIRARLSSLAKSLDQEHAKNNAKYQGTLALS